MSFSPSQTGTTDTTATTTSAVVARPAGLPESCFIEIRNNGAVTVRFNFGAVAVGGQSDKLAAGEAYITPFPTAQTFNIITDNATAACTVRFWA